MDLGFTGLGVYRGGFGVLGLGVVGFRAKGLRV